MEGSSVKMNCSRGGRLFPLWLCAVVYLVAQPGACNVVLMANNTTLSFSDVEATFTPAVEGSGVSGVIYTVEPLDACSPLRKRAAEGPVPPFALIIRGGCQFDDKVRNAQDAGFKTVIVYDSKDHGVLVSSKGIARFISVDLGTELPYEKVCSLNGSWQLLTSLMDLYPHGNNRMDLLSEIFTQAKNSCCLLRHHYYL